MRTGRRLVSFIAMLLVLAATAHGQTTLPQFKAAVADFQKSSTNESALKVIELFKQLAPPPGIPEEAREPFVIANKMLGKAPDEATVTKAIEFYDKAVHLAPWWSDAYFNRAIAHETAGHFDQAIDDLKLYLAFKLSEAERREAQDKIYSLKADREMEAAKTAKAAEAAAIDAKARLLEGEWRQDVSRNDASRSGSTYLEVLSLKRNASGAWQVRFVFTQDGNVVADYRPYDAQGAGAQLRFKIDHTFGSEVVVTYEITPTISDDGRILKVLYTPMPFTTRQEAHWVEWSNQRPRIHVDEFTR